MSPCTPPETPNEPEAESNPTRGCLVIVLTVIIASSSILMVGPQIILIVPLARLLYHHPSGTPHMVLRDGDTFEARNDGRQMSCPALEGQHKVEVLSGMILSQVHDSFEVVTDTLWITGMESALPLLFDAKKEQGPDEYLLIVNAVDNDATRAMIYDAIDEVPKVNVLVIDPANDLITGNVMCWIRDSQGNEPFLHPRERYKQIKEPKDRPPGGGCAEQTESTPQLITANMMAATIALHMVWVFLEGGVLADEAHFDFSKWLMWGDEMGNIVSEQEGPNTMMLDLEDEAHDAAVMAQAEDDVLNEETS